MNHKTRHTYIDLIGLAFMILGIIGFLKVDLYFGLLMVLGVATFILNETLNPFDGERK